MKQLLRAAGFYTAVNVFTAGFGLCIVLFIAGIVEPDIFGNYAAFIALQNAWAMIAFLRIESRISNCSSENDADSILWAGIVFASLFSSAFAILFMAMNLSWLNIPLVIISGFFLALIDAVVLRLSYSGNTGRVAEYRFVRVIAPNISIASVFYLGYSLSFGIYVLTLILSMYSFVIITRLNKPNDIRLLPNLIKVLRENRSCLPPASALGIVNAVWINGLTPFLNVTISPAIAGQFAIINRVLTGSFGLIGQAIYLTLNLNSNRTDLTWRDYKKIFTVCIIFSSICCVALYAGFYFLGNHSNFSFKTIDDTLYVCASLFSVASFSVGAISILAIRLKDEWYLLNWQVFSLFCWGGIYFIFGKDDFIYFSLLAGALLYLILFYRWRGLMN